MADLFLRLNSAGGTDAGVAFPLHRGVITSIFAEDDNISFLHYTHPRRIFPTGTFPTNASHRHGKCNRVVWSPGTGNMGQIPSVANLGGFVGLVGVD